MRGTEDLILPQDLVDKRRMSAAEFSQNREKRQWFLERGIDPGDWSQVYPILKASWKAHGVPDAAERARLRLKVTGSN